MSGLNSTTRFNIEGSATGATDASQVAGIVASYSFANATTDGFTFGNRFLTTVNNSVAASGSIGTLLRMTDNSTGIRNTTRALEVQAWSGSNITGVNTAVAAFAKTFGLHAYTDARASGKVNAAAVYAELGNQVASNSGNAIRAYSSYALTSDLVDIFHSSSSYTGDALMIDMASGSGTFTRAGSGSFIKLNKAGANLFRIDADGNAHVNISTRKLATNNGICADIASASRLGDCNTSPTDLAENFGTTDASIEAGDIVVQSGEGFGFIGSNGFTTKAWIKRSSQSYQNTVLGVVSTAPNQTYGEDIFNAEENPRPVTLAGRVPVKVNLQNGPIKAGDMITASDVAGIGMKADRPGMVVGMALESMSSESYAMQVSQLSNYGTIIVFINPGYWVPTASDVADSGTASSSVEFVYGGMTMASLFDAVVDKFADVFEIVFEKGILRVANIISDKLTTDELCIGETCVTEDQLKALLDATGVPQQAPEPSPLVTPTPTPDISATPSPSPETSPEVSPSPEVTPETSPAPIPEVSATPAPSVEPSPSATPEPTIEPTPEPTVEPTAEPIPELPIL